jgi:YVTN family beta-propeller protein
VEGTAYLRGGLLGGGNSRLPKRCARNVLANWPTRNRVRDEPSDGVSATAGGTRCRATAFVTNNASNSVSTIDLQTRTKHPTDIPVGAAPLGLGITPDAKTAFVTNFTSGTVSTIDVSDVIRF